MRYRVGYSYKGSSQAHYAGTKENAEVIKQTWIKHGIPAEEISIREEPEPGDKGYQPKRHRWWG